MTREEAIMKARAYAEERGWQCEGKFIVSAYRKYILFGDKYFVITGNTNWKDGNWHLRIDDKTGEVFYAVIGLLRTR